MKGSSVEFQGLEFLPLSGETVSETDQLQFCDSNAIPAESSGLKIERRQESGGVSFHGLQWFAVFWLCIIPRPESLQPSMKQANFINILHFRCCRGCFYQCYGINTAIDILYEYKWSLLFFYRAAVVYSVVRFSERRAGLCCVYCFFTPSKIKNQLNFEKDSQSENEELRVQ